MKKITAITLFFAMFFGCTGIALGKDPDQEEKVYAVQNKVYHRTHELGIAAGYIPDEDFYEIFPVGGYYMFSFNEHWAWEVVRGQYNLTLEKDLKKELEDKFGVSPSEFSEPKYMAHSNIVYKPFYGKFAFRNRKVVNSETFFLLGGGVVAFENKRNFEESTSELAPSLSLGLGTRFFLSKRWAMNLELRNYTNFREVNTENRFYLGVSFGLRFNLSPRKKDNDPRMEKLNQYLKED